MQNKTSISLINSANSAFRNIYCKGGMNEFRE